MTTNRDESPHFGANRWLFRPTKREKRSLLVSDAPRKCHVENCWVALSNIDGLYGLACNYEVSDVGDPWKKHNTDASPFLNDLTETGPGEDCGFG